MAKKLSAYNRYMRSALKGKMRGKTKAQRKAIFRAAAKGWSKTSAGKRSKSVSRVKKSYRMITAKRSKPRTKTKVSKPMSKKRGFLSTATFMKFARLAALAAPAAIIATGAGDAPSKIKEGLRIYTGFDSATGQWSIHNLAQGWLPFIGTSLITVGISKLNGIIRRL